MSDATKDHRKRPPPASSSGESTTSTPKPDVKKSKTYNPLDEATPLGQRRSNVQSFTSSSSSSATTVEPASPVEPAKAEDGGEVFNPHDKTVAGMSLDDSESDDLFELAMTAENWDQAEALASSDNQKRRAWLAKKNKVRSKT